MHFKSKVRAFEFILIGIIISLLILIAFYKLFKTFAIAESTVVDMNITRLRQALQMEILSRHSKHLPTVALAGSNPMKLMMLPPHNYLGSFNPHRDHQPKLGVWYFDESDKSLVYRVKHYSFFYSTSNDKQIRLKITAEPIKTKKQLAKPQQYSLSLRVIYPFRWCVDVGYIHCKRWGKFYQ